MNYNDLTKHFTENFKEYKPLLQEHIDFNGEVLNHVFFGECNDYFIELIGKEKDIAKIKGLFNFFGEKLGYKPFAKEKRIWTGVFNTLESATTAQQNISHHFGFNSQIIEEK